MRLPVKPEVRTPSKLPPLALIGLWRDLGQEARTNWSGQVVAEEGRRKVLSHRWRRACDREHGCEVSTKVVGRLRVRLLRKGATDLAALPR